MLCDGHLAQARRRDRGRQDGHHRIPAPRDDLLFEEERRVVLLGVDERPTNRVDATGDALVPEVNGPKVNEALGAKKIRVDGGYRAG
jgi:hypothetical protein